MLSLRIEVINVLRTEYLAGMSVFIDDVPVESWRRMWKSCQTITYTHLDSFVSPC